MEILTRLNAKAGISEGFGGVPELTTSDIAAALAGANKNGLILLLGQICRQGDFKAIYKALFPEVQRLAFRLKWPLKSPGPARMAKLTEIVLIETLSGKKCPSCHGTKASKINPVNDCPTCQGSGNWMYDYMKANYMGISDRAYRKTWSEREKDIKSLFERRMYSAKKRIYLNLYGES